jgi:hypothetical protein
METKYTKNNQTNVNRGVIGNRLIRLTQNATNNMDIKRRLERNLIDIEMCCGFCQSDMQVEGFKTIYQSYSQGLFTQKEELGSQLYKYARHYLIQKI